MSYEKQTWVTGETITAEKLNHMEDGIADGGSEGTVIVNVNQGTGEHQLYFILDKTAGEIKALLNAGNVCFVKYDIDSVPDYFDNGIHKIGFLSWEHFDDPESENDVFHDNTPGNGTFRAENDEDYPMFYFGD